MSSPAKRIAAAVGRTARRDELRDQGGLAGAVRTDDRVQLAWRDIERKIVGSDDAAEALGEMPRPASRARHDRPR